MRLMHNVVLPANSKRELAVSLFFDLADFLHQRDDISPSQVTR